MIGLIALVILMFWIFIVNKISKKLTQLITLEKIKRFARPILFVFVFCAPVIDEIIGGFQFRYLCYKDSMPFVNEEKARGKTLVEDSSNIELEKYFIPIKKYNFLFRDIDTNEVAVSWIYYRAHGGWLARAIDFGSSHAPFIFNGSCQPVYSGSAIVKDLNIILLSKTN